MKRIAIANLKGGVGKSTTTLMVAEHWAKDGRRVLVIDLDLQGNVSAMLLSRQGLDQAAANRTTTSAVFDDALAGNVQNSRAYLIWRASDLVELHNDGFVGRVSVLPSVPKLWFNEQNFDYEQVRQGRDPVDGRVEILTGFLTCIENEFDVVLMDCPPGFGTLTRAAIVLADTIVSPTIADITSTRSLADFVSIGLRDILAIVNQQQPIVVITKYQDNREMRDTAQIVRDEYFTVLTEVRLRTNIAQLAQRLEGRMLTYSQKYNRPRYNSVGRNIRQMCSELEQAIFE